MQFIIFISSKKVEPFYDFFNDNPMIDKDGSYNCYLFIDTLYFEKESPFGKNLLTEKK